MIRKYIFLLVLIGSFSLAATAWGCDCTHFPIKPDTCLKPCQTAALFKSNQQELTSIFGLDDDTARLLVDKRASLPAETTVQLKRVVPPSEYSKIVDGANSISEKDTSELAVKYKLDSIEPEDRKESATNPSSQNGPPRNAKAKKN